MSIYASPHPTEWGNVTPATKQHKTMSPHGVGVEIQGTTEQREWTRQCGMRSLGPMIFFGLIAICWHRAMFQDGNKRCGWKNKQC